MVRHIRSSVLTLLVFAAVGRADEPAAAVTPPPAANETDEIQDDVSDLSTELRQKREQLSRLQAEIRELEQQTGEYERVLLRCRFFEADASIVQELRLEGDDARPPLTAVVKTAALDEVIETMRSRGDGRTLAEPSIITTSGRSTSVFSGGEFPVVIPSEGEARVEWREFGHRVDAVPTMLGGGRLRLDVSPQCSVRDFAHAVEIEGRLIPGLHVQRVQTRFELKFDQSAIVLMRGASAAAPQGDLRDATDAEAGQKIVLFAVTAEPVASGE